MAVTIIWSETSGGSQVTDNIRYVDSGSGDIDPGESSDPKDLYIRHDSVSKITSAGFFVTKFNGTYSGNDTKENDLSEILGWGNDVVLSIVVADASTFNLDAILTGQISGATGTITSIDLINDILAVSDVTGEYEAAETVIDDGGVPGSSTVTSTSDAGIYINQNYLDSFLSTYTILNVADGSSFFEGLTITGTTSFAFGVIVAIETNTIVVSAVTGTFQDAEQVTDTDTGDSTVSSVDSRSAWTKVMNNYGNDLTHTIPLTVDSLIGGVSAGQANGELNSNQTANIQVKVIAPTIASYSDLDAGLRQFSTVLAYQV